MYCGMQGLGVARGKKKNNNNMMIMTMKIDNNGYEVNRDEVDLTVLYPYVTMFNGCGEEWCLSQKGISVRRWGVRYALGMLQFRERIVLTMGICLRISLPFCFHPPLKNDKMKNSKKGCPKEKYLSGRSMQGKKVEPETVYLKVVEGGCVTVVAVSMHNCVGVRDNISFRLDFLCEQKL